MKEVSRKQRQTLAALFARRDRKDIHWDDFIGLPTELGADITERGNSMVGPGLNRHYAVFHRPHPGNVIYPSMLKINRHFLNESGVPMEIAGRRE